MLAIIGQQQWYFINVRITHTYTHTSRNNEIDKHET